MERSFQDFVDSVKIMLGRDKPATDQEIISWLNANGVYSEADNILKTAKTN